MGRASAPPFFRGHSGRARLVMLRPGEMLGLVVVVASIEVIGVVNEQFTVEVLDLLHAWALQERVPLEGGA